MPYEVVRVGEYLCTLGVCMICMHILWKPMTVFQGQMHSYGTAQTQCCLVRVVKKLAN